MSLKFILVTLIYLLVVLIHLVSCSVSIVYNASVINHTIRKSFEDSGEISGGIQIS